MALVGGALGGALAGASERRIRAAHAAHASLRVPAAIMAPRVVFALAVVLLALFGLTMIYSASLVEALLTTTDGTEHYFVRQLGFIAAGVLIAAALYFVGYRLLHGWGIAGVTAACILLLLLVRVVGTSTLGATRWIALGPFTLQPSEFAKVAVIVVAANLLGGLVEGTIAPRKILLGALGGVVLPMALILIQPDKGSTAVVGATILVLLYLAGVRGPVLAGIAALAGIALLWLALKDDYSRQRIQIMLNPYADPDGVGYQFIQGQRAFGSGGLLGVGIGQGRQKYSYIPMAYTDFIYAVVGEELGLVGTLGVLAGFGVLLVSAVKIARNAPTLTDRLIVMGLSSMLVIQLFLNVLGVLGMIPLSGKPIPFLSYGGSSVVSSLVIAGIVLAVSHVSTLPQTEHDERRRSWLVSGGGRGEAEDDTGVGAPRARGRAVQAQPRSDGGPHAQRSPATRLTVLGGGRPGALGSSRGGQGWQRVNLGADAGERLRGTPGGSQVRTRTQRGRGDFRDR